MIYGVKKWDGWVQFDAQSETWMRPSDVPTPTTNLAQAERILLRVPPEWRCEIVHLAISWRKPN